MLIGIVAQSSATSRQVTSCLNKVFNISQAIFLMKGIIVINIFYCEEVMEKKKGKQRGKMALLSYQHTARVEFNSEGYLFSQLTEL